MNTEILHSSNEQEGLDFKNLLPLANASNPNL